MQRDSGTARTVITALVFATGLVCAVPARAQSNASLLMRTAWSECGVECAPHEIAALAEVIAGIADREDVRWSTAWRLASPRLAAGTISRAWLADIDERCAEPDGWPTHVWERDGEALVRRAHPRWRAYRERCAALAATCRAVLAGEVRSLCVEAPRVWGSEADASRPTRARFEAVDCGDTRNLFGRWVTR